MKRLALIVMVVFGLSLLISQAEARTLLSLGANLTYQTQTSGQSYDMVTPLAVRAGYRFKFLDVYGEYSYAQAPSDGTEMIQVRSASHEFLVWARKSFALSRFVKPFGALALGVQRQDVSTSYKGEVSRDSGQLNGAAAAAVGLLFRPHRYFEFSLEGKVTASETQAPNPRFGVAGFAGFVF